VEDLFDYRGQPGIDEAAPPLWLPYNQGDVFSGVSIPGVDDELARGAVPLVLLFLHPCTMRRGAVLVPEVTVVQVRWFAKRVMDSEDWENGRYSVMPLPDLRGDGTSTHVGDFLRIGTVPGVSLNRGERIATFSRSGRTWFQRRVIHHLTRLEVPLGDLASATRGVEREVELQASWCEAACDQVGSSTLAVIAAAESDFDAYMSEKEPIADSAEVELSRRARLIDDALTHQVAGEVHREIRTRYGAG